MTTYAKAVELIANEIYKTSPQQILIDFVQEEVEPLFDIEDPPSRDAVMAVSYQADILLDVYNPKFEFDINILTKLEKALSDWSKDIEATNVILGLPKQN